MRRYLRIDMLSLIILIIEIMLLHVIKTIGIVRIDNSLASVLIIIFSISFVVSVQNSDLTKKYSRQILTGYAFRILLLYFDLFGQSIRRLPQSGADSSMFYRTSTELVLYGKTNKSSGFITIMYRVFSFIGINRLYGQFLLMLLSVAAIIIFILTLVDLNIKEKSKTNGAWIICLLPNFALLSSLFLRESIVMLLISISIYCMNAWIDGDSTLYSMSAIAFSAIACFFHSGCIGITIGCIVCLLLYDKNRKEIHPTIAGFFLAFAIAFGLSYVFLNYGESLMEKFMGIETFADIANISQSGGSSYARFVGNSDNPGNMVLYTIPRIIYFLFSPFPWQWRGISDIIAFFFSGLFYLIAIKNAVLYLHDGKKDNREKIICLLIIAFFCTFIFAWGVSNTGTATRHRDKMVCLYGIIYALTLRQTELDSEGISSYIKQN